MKNILQIGVLQDSTGKQVSLCKGQVTLDHPEVGVAKATKFWMLI